MFLRKNPHTERNLPHEGLYVSFGQLGKVDIRNDKLTLPYTFKREEFNEFHKQMREKPYERFVELPLNLVIEIAKASVKDYDATKPLEENIKEAIEATPETSLPKLDEDLIEKLRAQSKRILENRDEAR